MINCSILCFAFEPQMCTKSFLYIGCFMLVITGCFTQFLQIIHNDNVFTPETPTEKEHVRQKNLVVLEAHFPLSQSELKLFTVCYITYELDQSGAIRLAVYTASPSANLLSASVHHHINSSLQICSLSFRYCCAGVPGNC